MLKKLQWRFIAITMFALTCSICVHTVTVNLFNLYQRDSDVKNTLMTIAENGGNLPYNEFSPNILSGGMFNPFSEYKFPETPFSTRYFVVEMMGNTVTKISVDHIASVDAQAAFNYAASVYENNPPGFGFSNYFRYYYTQNGNRSMIIFIDYQEEIRDTVVLAFLSATVGIVTLLVLLVCVYFLSKKALSPVAESIKKQKQFITDAGHELKTPLAIISADAEVLEMCEGENEWVTSIKNQTVRMNSLVKNLVELSKLNEAQDTSQNILFNISTAVEETASEFESRAKIANKNFAISVTPDLKYHGNEKEIRQLVSILCDNAIKYSDSEGTIQISLYKWGKSLCLDAFNTTDYVDPKNVSKLFERFYRADSSRSRETGGYGIGLSIAAAIVERHKGKIKAVTNGTKEITFKITL